MGRSVVAFIALWLMILAACPALAYEYSSPEYWAEREALRLQEAAARERLDTLATELQARDKSTWTMWELERYYRAVVDLLYHDQRSSVIASQVDFTLVSAQVVAQGKYWPKDPLNGWELLPVQEIGDDPLPGGIVMQCCPADRYSDNYRRAYPQPQSFEISIYAPKGLEPQRVRPRAGNRGWTKVRPEMLAMQGWFTPPYTLIADPDYDFDMAAEKAADVAHGRDLALGWYRATYPEPPGGVNIYLENTLRGMATVLHMDEELARLEEQYGDLPPAQWTAEDRETWSFNSMFIVYSASLAYESIEGAMRGQNFDVDFLRAAGFIPRTPPNPYDGGRPIRILRPADGFSPGDLCLMWPTSYWVGYDTDGLKPVMIQVFAYGAEPDPAREAELARQLSFTDGTYQVPPGAIQTSSTYTSGYLLNVDYKQALCLS